MNLLVLTRKPGNRNVETTTFAFFLSFALLVLAAWLPSATVSGQSIVAENALTGNPASEWDITGAGDLSIQGFATDISINTGQTVNFKINVADASNYTIKIYRLGYYQGNGARLIADLGTFTGTVQPSPITDVSTGLLDCGNWSTSASWTATGAVSGVYIAKLTKTVGGGSSHIIFIVRNDAGNSDILFKTSDATWQAYNIFGGNSFYVGTTAGYPSGHGVKISYNRPFISRDGGGGGGVGEDWIFNAEYPMIRWMERNGYNVSYTTDVDMDRDPTPLTPSIHKVLLSVGHDEYWSPNERSKFETARNNGVHLAFLSGNEVYWKTRWENSIDGSNTPHRTLVCYKEGTLGENVCGSNCDPLPNVWTGLWRAGCGLGEDGCQPENALTGQISWGQAETAITVPDIYKNFRFWRNTSITSLGSGQSATLSDSTIGFEFDWQQNQYDTTYPIGRVPLSFTDVNGKQHLITLYRHSSGALVFGAGTVQWSWGLDGTHDRGGSTPDVRMQQATLNLFAEMGVQPGSIQAGLTATTSSGDNLAPSSVIAAPLNAANITTSSYITINGSCTETGGGVIAAVKISTDNGLTWHAATGTTSWTYSWLPTSSGTYTIKVRAFDDLGNLEAEGTVPSTNAISVNVTVTAPVCPCTLFDTLTPPTPANLLLNDHTPIEAGTKFKSSVDGYVTAIRFYKPGNTGVYSVNLWDNATQQRITFAVVNESGIGWKKVSLPTPVPIIAGHEYVATYYSSSGDYASTDNFFTTAFTNGYLTGLQNVTGNENGVFHLGQEGSPEQNYQAFPTEFYQASNYWVDVEFNTSIPPDTTPPTVSGVTPHASATGIALNSKVRAIFSESIDPATISDQSFELRNGATVISATVTYNDTARTATLTPLAPLSYSTTYTATIKGGAVYNAVKDLVGNNMAQDTSWSFTTINVPPPPPTEGPGGPILVISATSNPFSRYTVEILRAQGLNEFSARDISQINTDTLNRYDVVILGEMPLSAGNVTDLTNWVNAGGTLIAFKPDNQLNSLLGITPAGGSLSDKYLLVNTATGTPGAGVVGRTIQFHGAAVQYNLSGATSLATLYSDASTTTAYPAVTTRNIGSNGGKAIAFAYDLCRSIVYTRQGNPAWEGQKRDGQITPVRSDDMFYGNASFDPQPDWIDFNKVNIPQADEQQHLLTNIISLGNLHRKPLPRFWFLPRKLKAAIVMTGDDHANAGTVGRFNQFLGYGNNSAQDVLDWKAIRGTSYIYPNTPISDSLAAAFTAQGFEIGLHLTTNCDPYTQSTLQGFFSTQLPMFTGNFPSLPAPNTHRTHCIAWSDWASKPKVELANGIRLNTDYYYWPSTWVNNRVGMFTGSGMPMRFADLDGSIIDDYQVTTQMPDESGLTISSFVSTLLDSAIGGPGFYGVFCANMHTDFPDPSDISTIGATAIVNAAIARNIPVVSARQMLTWLDGRNNSSFQQVAWTGNTLNFSIAVANGAHQLQAMVPVAVSNGELLSITLNGGTPVTYTTEVIKGVNYAFFDATAGNYAAVYAIDDTPPVISNIQTTPHIDGTVTVTWTTDEPASTRIDYGTDTANLNQNSASAPLVTNHSIVLNGLSVGTKYYFRITAADQFNNSSTEPTSPAIPLSFTTPNSLCFLDQDSAQFGAGTTGDSTYVSLRQDGELTLKPVLAAEFSSLPSTSQWDSYPWTAGTSTVSGGQLIVNGARFNTEPEGSGFGPGSSVEFVATFGAINVQHIGFGGGTDGTGSGSIFNGNVPWAMFGTGSSTTVLKARCADGSGTLLDFDIPGSWLGSPHLYRIDWKASSVDFYIDSVLVHTENVTIAGPMRIAVSDFFSSAPSLAVDWIHVSPYPLSGTFLSRIYDAGTAKTWQTALWDANLPAGTTMQISQRRGITPTPDANWTAFSVIPSSGSNVGGTSRYIQYKVEFTTNNSIVSPILNSFGIACDTATNSAPEVTTDPLSQARCEGDTVRLVSGATAFPDPTVQWQVSTDNGANWADTVGAVNDTLTFIATAADSARQYRAVWSNVAGNDTSAAAILTVHAKPIAFISAVDTAVCDGSAVVLRLDSATGPGPYTLKIDSTIYSNISPGQNFASLHPLENSVWGTTGTPVDPNHSDGVATEVGVKFRASVDGYIKGIRFYKGSSNTGTHVGSLWNKAGAQLATATFSGETASGWQEVRFSSPVFVKADTTYIASYSTPNGVYALSPGFFASSPVVNGQLTALQSGTDGPNGVILAGTGFPSAGTDANYWVDVLFEAVQTSPVTLNFKLTSVTNGNGCSNSGDSLTSASVTINTIPAGTITASSATTCNESPINLTFNATNGTGPFTLVINDSTYTNVTSGTPFNTRVNATANLDSQTIFSPSSIGDDPPTEDASSIELGIKFRTSVPGTITGIRFYKRAGNTGTHTGSLWTSTGTLLATATFTGETATGWQQVNFSTPVAITPGVTYIASYFAPDGHYAYTANAFTSSGITNASGTITALKAGVDGGNGVFFPNFAGGFPNLTGADANYWVDVVFKPTAGIASFNLTSIASATGCVATGSPISSANVAITQVNATASITNVTCNGSNNGAINVTGINGTAPYTYSIDTGANFQSSGTFSNLVAGNYLVRIKDSTGCIKDTVLTVTQPTAVSASIVITNVNCFGSATGAVTLTGTGGVGTYLYSKDTGATFQSSGAYSNLLAGNYLFKIKDTNNCVKDTVVVVAQNSAVDAAVTITNVDCFGSANGIVVLSGTGGVGPYTYSKDTGATYQSSGTFNSLIAGNYLFKIKDSNDCVKDTAITITQPAQVTGTIAPTSPTTCNGSIVSLIFTQTAGLPAGPFTLIINDSTYSNVVSGTPFDTRVNANAILDTQTIFAPSTIGDDPAVPDNSSIELGVKFRTTVAGKITGIRFYKRLGNTGTHKGSLWTSTGTLLATATFSGETATGWQQVNFSTPVTITPGVTYVASYFAPDGNYAYTPNAFTTSGITNASGTITALKSGVDGGNGVFLPGFAGGFPNVSGADANYWVDVVFVPTGGVATFNLTSISTAAGCVTTGSPISTTAVNISQVNATAVITNVTCNGNNNGALNITGINGTAPYTYSIDNGANFQSSGVFTNLVANSYNVVIKDSTGCTKDTVLVVSQPAAITPTVNVTNLSCFGSGNGAFTVTTAGGTAPYTYSIDTGATFQSSGNFTNLVAGNYLLRIKDANNCTKDTVITVTQPAQVSGSLSTINSCPGNPINLVFNASAGTGPFTLVINGTTYNNVSNGGIINTGVTPTGGPETIWDSTTVGGIPPIVDNGAVEVGVKFRSNVAGQITGIRFYKLAANAGTHTGSLWTSTGTLLATATFSGETASGWQQVNFSTPVTITPGVTYVASYYAPFGNYAFTADAFTNGAVTNGTGTLTALKSSEAGGNGVFHYGGGGIFPADTGATHPNFWVDVVFNNTAGIAKYDLTSITSADGCTTTASPISSVTVGIVPVNASIVKTILDCPSSTNGTLTITGSGGAAPYMYSIDNGANYQSSGSFTNLGAGTYLIKVKDVNGCTKDTSAVIDVEVATWTGATSNDWHTASNWSTNQVPTATTHVIVPSGTPNPCVVSNADADAASVQAKTGATVNVINNHVLTIHGKCSTLPPM